MARKLKPKRKAPKPKRATRKTTRKTAQPKRRQANPFKGHRATVNIPWIWVEPIATRVAECPYKSESDYFLGLAIFDCWSRRPHRYTSNLLAQPPKVRDAAFAQLAEQFKKGQQKSTDPGWFDNFVKRVVDEEIRKAGGSPL